MRRALAGICLVILGLGGLWGQKGGAPLPVQPLSVAPEALPRGISSAKPENRLRRFEIIAFGSYPIALFYTNLGFQVYTYAAQGFSADYAPWPFSGSLADSLSDEDRFTRMGVAAGVSLVVATADLLIRLGRERRKALDAGRTLQGQTSPP